MEFVGKILVLLALAGIAAIEVYHKEENTGLMNLILVLIAAVVVIIAIVQGIQWLGNKIVRNLSRNR